MEALDAAHRSSPLVRSHLGRPRAGAFLATLIKRSIEWLKERRRMRRATHELMALDDRMLADIGVSRGEILHAVLAATGATASADHNLYPPGWNKPDPNAPPSLFEFRPGWGWNDSQRYWPDQNSRGTPASRPITEAPVIFGMVPGGHRYHRLP
jgi:uncharacterized protein YjiS (DUF1127 family)